MPKPKKFILIAGPCVLESEELALQIGKEIKKVAVELDWEYYFKASYDKANRTSVRAPRGPGLKKGLEILARIRKELDVPVLTDVHSVEDVAIVASTVDVLQIPAFLCRQTDLIAAAAWSGKPVNVKKGQFLAPEDVDSIAEKLKSSGCQQYWITERGTTFGYHNLVVDMRGLVTMREKGHKIIFDATHSVQRPSGLGGKTGGDGRLAPYLARAAMAVGIDGLFVETHPDPLNAPSDAENMIPLAELPDILRQLERIRKSIE